MKKGISIFLIFFVSIAWGNQVLHTKPNDKPYQRSAEFIDFVETEFQGAAVCESDAEVLRFASEQIRLDGVFIELGTGMGRTTNFLAALNPQKTIYTFDSYLGHPAEWDKGDRVLAKDFCAWPAGEKLPQLLNNVVLVQGWFADTLPVFVQTLKMPIAFLHVDCEIYESTTQALDFLGPQITDGTIILFDEFYNYPNFRNHEYKAFQEFLEKYSFEAEYLAYNALHEQVAVRVHRIKMHQNSERNAPLIRQTVQEANSALFSNQSLRIELLKNCPEVIPELAEWEYQDWHLYDTSLTREKLIEEFNQSLNDDKLPLTLVAFRSDIPIGVISLTAKSEPEFSDLEDGNPWGGSFHVIPTERARKLGENLAAVAVHIAKKLGHSKIHFFTSNPRVVNWYTRRGAQVLETRPYRNHVVTMMEFPIN